MNQPTFLASVLARLSAVRSPDLPRVAEGSGVPESTVRKLRYGEVKNPRVHTVQALHDYFEGAQGPTPAGSQQGAEGAAVVMTQSYGRRAQELGETKVAQKETT